jgi:replicative DNA helicase
MTSSRRTDNRVQEISEISRALKGLARELDIPVVALAQLSRAVESRQSHVPMLSDLRESGSIEQDADIVMFIYREDVYDAETEKKGIADIIVAKHRNGPVGTVHLRFFDRTARFADLELYREPDL